MSEDPSLWTLVLGKETEKNLRSYQWQKQIYCSKNRKTNSKRWAKPREAPALAWYGTGVFQDRASVYLSKWAWADSFDWQCKLHNNRLFAHVFPITESVIIRCVYIWNIYEPLIGAQLSKITWGHSCAPRMQVPKLEKSLWLLCIHFSHRAHELGKVCVVIL